MIDLTVTATRSHLVHATTMLWSLAQSAPQRSFRVHLLHDGTVASADLEPVRDSLAGFDLELYPVAVPKDLQRSFPSHRFHVSAWFRILLPVLVPDLSRAIHVDVDTVVLDDVQALWDQDLDGRLFAAATNPLYPFQPQHWRTDLGLRSARDYLNSGVLVMDLDRMRDEGLVARLQAYAQARPDNRWPEQDALAATCSLRWLELPPRWNVQNTVYDLDADDLPYSSQELAEALARPAIVHFIGPYKPWTYACHHPLRHLYHEARNHTAYPPAALVPSRRQRVMRRLQEQDRARLARVEAWIWQARRRVRRS